MNRVDCQICVIHIQVEFDITTQLNEYGYGWRCPKVMTSCPAPEFHKELSEVMNYAAFNIAVGVSLDMDEERAYGQEHRN
jgi:hypothetical protein